MTGSPQRLIAPSARDNVDSSVYTYTQSAAYSSTYDHTYQRTRDPVRSPIDKLVRGGLVVGSVTTSESPLLYVIFAFLAATRRTSFEYRKLDLDLGLWKRNVVPLGHFLLAAREVDGPKNHRSGLAWARIMVRVREQE